MQTGLFDLRKQRFVGCMDIRFTVLLLTTFDDSPAWKSDEDTFQVFRKHRTFRALDKYASIGLTILSLLCSEKVKSAQLDFNNVGRHILVQLFRMTSVWRRFRLESMFVI